MGHEVVRVDYHKYDGSPHRGYPALRLGEDEHGIWLGVAPQFFPTAEFKYLEPYALLLPRDGWWTAMFIAPPRRTEIYCDIASPARWVDETTVHVVDLDLDVRRRRASGMVELLDEDEFAVHALRFGYPDEVRRQAWAAAHHLLTALGDGSEPFAGGYRQWLGQVQDRLAQAGK
jgi:protein associated with RNAse G/E